MPNTHAVIPDCQSSGASRGMQFIDRVSVFRRLGVSAFTTLLLASPAFADSVKGVRPGLLAPIAPRGGVLMIPLVAERAGDNWPRTIDIKMADGRKIEGVVVWIATRPDAGPVTWTSDPRRLSLREIDRTDDTLQLLGNSAGEGPYLLARLPENGDGALQIEGRNVNPVWRDVPWNDPLRDAEAPAPDGALTLEEAPDRPDPQSPFEYWRWVLLADRLGLRPPTPLLAGGGGEGDAGGDDLQRLAAEHYAVLWRIGMARLAAGSRRIAMECRDMLTRTAVDRSRTAATWVTDPTQISTLLGELLDFTRPDQDALSSAVAWLDQQPTITVWPEDASGDQVLLAMTSLRDQAIPVSFTWLGSKQPPARQQVEPGVIMHVSVNRLPLQPPPIVGAARLVEPPTQLLRIDAGDQHIDLNCGPRVTVARPPGVTFRPLSPPISLADAQFNRVMQTPGDRVTIVQIRRLSGRWEVFFECRRDQEKQQTLDPTSLRSFDDLRGIEAVTLLLGREEEDGAPAVWLTIPEHDWPAVVRGANLPDLQVHKRSFADRWNCRVVLPDQWFSAAETNPAFVAFIRSHNDSAQLETGPAPSPPWRVSPGRVALDLAHWDDLPTAEQ